MKKNTVFSLASLISFLMLSSSVHAGPRAHALSDLHQNVLAESSFVIDAGSSGTRLYEYDYNVSSGGGLPKIQNQIKHDSIAGGIQTVDIEDLETYLSNLFSQTDTTPDHIYFYSTAGMRTISSTDRDEINTAIKHWLVEHFPNTDIQVKTISGQIEGAYAWLSANYINGSLKNDSQTYGIMKLGGASTQITFESNSGDDLLNIDVGNRQYTLSSTSYLGLGQDLSITQYLNEPTCFPVGYDLPNGQKGTGDFLECAIKVEPLINGTHSIASTQEKPQRGLPFYAIGGYYYTSSKFEIDSDFSLSDLAEKGKDFCSNQWDELEAGQTQYPVDSYLHSYCYNAAYQHTLLSKGYEFNDGENDITMVKKLDGKKISWTLGPVLAPKL